MTNEYLHDPFEKRKKEEKRFKKRETLDVKSGIQ